MDDGEVDERRARGARLKEAREQKKAQDGGVWTLEYVASQLGVTKAAVGHWETGHAAPPYDKLIRLCRLYGVPAEHIIYGTNTSTLDIDFRTVAYIHAMRITDAKLRAVFKTFLDEVTNLTRNKFD